MVQNYREIIQLDLLRGHPETEFFGFLALSEFSRKPSVAHTKWVMVNVDISMADLILLTPVYLTSLTQTLGDDLDCLVLC